MLSRMGAIVTSTTLFALGTILFPSSAVARGGFSESCKNLKLNFKGGPILEADCLDEAGNWNHSTINLNNYIANMNGNLVWLENGNFGSTCQGPELAGSGPRSTNTAILVVVCRTSGSMPFQNNRFNLDERIANQNGKLTYEP